MCCKVKLEMSGKLAIGGDFNITSGCGGWVCWGCTYVGPGEIG